jgi:hypothetical protein
MIVRGLQERARVFRKARAAEAGPGVQKFGADAVVEPHAARHVLDVGSDFFRQVRHLVDETDLGRQKCIGGTFDQFGAAPAGIKNGRAVEVKRPINFRHHLTRTLLVGAHHDAVGMLEILDRCALAQEFRIGHDGDVRIRPHLHDNVRDFIAGAYRHRRFSDHHRKAGQCRRDVARGGI